MTPVAVPTRHVGTITVVGANRLSDSPAEERQRDANHNEDHEAPQTPPRHPNHLLDGMKAVHRPRRCDTTARMDLMVSCPALRVSMLAYKGIGSQPETRIHLTYNRTEEREYHS